MLFKITNKINRKEYLEMIKPKKNSTTRWHSGKRLDLDNIFFRSKQEANYARFLTYLKIPFIYEKECFSFPLTKGCTSYTPDFYLSKSDKYVEFKGWLSPKSITKLKRFKKYYPKHFSKLHVILQDYKDDIVLKLLDIGVDYDRISSYEPVVNLKSLIPNWEY